MRPLHHRSLQIRENCFYLLPESAGIFLVRLLLPVQYQADLERNAIASRNRCKLPALVRSSLWVWLDLRSLQREYAMAHIQHHF